MSRYIITSFTYRPCILLFTLKGSNQIQYQTPIIIDHDIIYFPFSFIFYINNRYLFFLCRSIQKIELVCIKNNDEIELLKQNLLLSNLLNIKYVYESMRRIFLLVFIFLFCMNRQILVRSLFQVMVNKRRSQQ